MTKQNKNQTTILETFEKEWYLLNGNNKEIELQKEIEREKHSRSVSVQNISDKVTKEDLFDLFSKYGIVLSIIIKNSVVANEAIIEFQTSEPIDKVVQLTGHELYQKRLIVRKF